MIEFHLSKLVLSRLPKTICIVLETVCLLSKHQTFEYMGTCSPPPTNPAPNGVGLGPLETLISEKWLPPLSGVEIKINIILRYKIIMWKSSRLLILSQMNLEI